MNKTSETPAPHKRRAEQNRQAKKRQRERERAALGAANVRKLRCEEQQMRRRSQYLPIARLDPDGSIRLATDLGPTRRRFASIDEASTYLGVDVLPDWRPWMHPQAILTSLQMAARGVLINRFSKDELSAYAWYLWWFGWGNLCKTLRGHGLADDWGASMRAARDVIWEVFPTIAHRPREAVSRLCGLYCTPGLVPIIDVGFHLASLGGGVRGHLIASNILPTRLAGTIRLSAPVIVLGRVYWQWGKECAARRVTKSTKKYRTELRLHARSVAAQYGLEES